MISVFLREQKRYTQENLVGAFQCSEERTVHILKRLKEYGVLKAVKASDAQRDLTDLVDEDSMFGTNSFNLVWEKVCAEVLDNQLQKPIGAISLPVSLAEPYQGIRTKKLIELIDKPIWASSSDEGVIFSHVAEDTLIPDIVSISQTDGEFSFIIFDAKYYNIQLEPNKKLRGQPGIESVTKQYLYQLAFKPFIS